MAAVLHHPLPSLAAVRLLSPAHQGEVVCVRRPTPSCRPPSSMATTMWARLCASMPSVSTVQPPSTSSGRDGTGRWTHLSGADAALLPRSASRSCAYDSGQKTRRPQPAPTRRPRTKTSSTLISMLRVGAYRRHTENHVRAGNTAPATAPPPRGEEHGMAVGWRHKIRRARAAAVSAMALTGEIGRLANRRRRSWNWPPSEQAGTIARHPSRTTDLDSGLSENPAPRRKGGCPRSPGGCASLPWSAVGLFSGQAGCRRQGARCRSRRSCRR
jgi:hypothetical protein